MIFSDNALYEFIKRQRKVEQKWMFHGDVDDADFGVETDKYQWCSRVLEGKTSAGSMLYYFQQNYSESEQAFIRTLEDLIRHCL